MSLLCSQSVNLYKYHAHIHSKIYVGTSLYDSASKTNFDKALKFLKKKDLTFKKLKFIESLFNNDSIKENERV